MKRKDTLTLDEFAVASRKTEALRPAPASSQQAHGDVPKQETVDMRRALTEAPMVHETRAEAHKALRRLKRDRLKGVQNFVNVHLDRETKKRLKLASFNSDNSMQSLMEAAIRKFLDDNGF